MEHMSHEESGRKPRRNAPSGRSAESPEARAQRVAELRARWLDGTIDDVLFPEDMNLDRLLADLSREPTPAEEEIEPSHHAQGRQR